MNKILGGLFDVTDQSTVGGKQETAFRYAVERINNNKKRINNNEKRINTITNDEIVTTPEENKHRSIETSAKRRRRTISERERSKSARAIWTFP